MKGWRKYFLLENRREIFDFPGDQLHELDLKGTPSTTDPGQSKVLDSLINILRNQIS